MARLLGHPTPYVVSMLENGKRKPCLHTVLIYQLLFDISIDKLIPEIHKHVEILLASRIKDQEHHFSTDQNRALILEKFKDVLSKPSCSNSKI